MLKIRPARAIVFFSVMLSIAIAGAGEIPFAPESMQIDNVETYTSIFPVDLDGDGDSDLVSASEHDDTIAWHEDTSGDGTTWSTVVLSAVAEGAWSVFAADVDGDGDMDVLSASELDDEIAWYDNDGTAPPTFTRRVITEDPDGPGGGDGPANAVRSVFATDLDRDGDTDVLAAYASGLQWYENTASDGSTWTSHLIPGSLNGGQSVYAADLDGDGDLDAIGAARVGDRIVWNENRLDEPSADFGLQQQISASADEVFQVTAADIDGDGEIDVVSASRLDDKIAWYENDGAASSFSERVITEDPDGAGVTEGFADGASSVISVDLDADGDLDLLSASRENNRVAWYENERRLCDDLLTSCDTDTTCNGIGSGTCTARFTAHSISTGVVEANLVQVVDLEADGDHDILSTANPSGTLGRIYAHENLTLHRSAAFGTQSLIFTTEGLGADVDAVDVDGDGDLDVVSVEDSADILRWHENLGGAGSFTPRPPLPSSSAALERASGEDIDDDGHVDLLLSSANPPSLLWFDNVSGDGTSWVEYSISLRSGADDDIFRYVRDAVAADLDGDGDLDVASVRTIPGGSPNNCQTSEFYELGWFRQDDPRTEPWTVFSLELECDLGAYFVDAADLDGDGDMDVLTTAGNGTIGKVVWYENDGSASPSFTPHTLASDTRGSGNITTADVDGDGDLDVVAADLDEITWYANDGTTGPWTGSALPLFAASGMSDFRVSDVDTDGDPDIVFALRANTQSIDELDWFENVDGDGGSWTRRRFSTNVAWPIGLVVADLDGDGRDDALVAAQNDRKIAWHANLGGQFALATTDTSPGTIADGGKASLMTIVATHNGRAGDGDLELASLGLLVEVLPGNPPNGAGADMLIGALSIYRDDGSGTFEEGNDTVVETIAPLSLSPSDVQVVTFADGDTRVQVAHGSPATFFVTAETTADASTQGLCGFDVTNLAASGATAEDRDFDINLTLEATSDTAAETVFYAPQVVSVSPADNSIEVPATTDIVVTFSEPVVPGSVTGSSFRVLDATLTAIPATVSVDPSGLIATLDPVDPLLETIHTIQVNPGGSGIVDADGCDAVEFESLFIVSATDDQLDTVSDETTTPPPASQSGAAVAQGGDIDGDGISDLLAGAPALDVGPATSAGGALVYLGDTEGTALGEPDIIFEGVAAHDRAGVSVAGNFDFNSPGLTGPDGVPDIVIGAEQFDRTLATPAATGAGKVYVIFFDRNDTTHYPNLGNPAVSDTVSLSLVEDGTIPGIVLTGIAFGDQAGFSVATGGDPDGDGNDDLLIGAPGSDPVVDATTRTDAGRSYLVYNDPALVGSRSLDDVACTFATPACAPASQIDGFAYDGGADGDRLGHSVAFPGDVVGTIGDDVAIGAPNASPNAIPGAGIAYAIQGGLVVGGIIEVCPVGTTIDGAQYTGTQLGEQLGLAIAGGGDALLDGTDDLLIGSPRYDVGGLIDAGRVVHIGSKQPTSVVAVSSVGGAVNGALWQGNQAGGQLGTSVAGLGDVNGDGVDDVAFGMPGADASGFSSASVLGHSEPSPTSPPNSGLELESARRDPSATTRGGSGEEGAVFRVDGAILSGTGPGVVDVGDVGPIRPGLTLVGSQAGEHAGAALAGTGDVSGDAAGDFAVGAPDFAAGNDGRVYVVLANPPTTCRPGFGCTASDLENGAQLEVDAAALTDQLILTVRGVLDPSELPAPAPMGRTLLGAVEIEPADAPFGVPAPTLHIPTRAELEAQLGVGPPDCPAVEVFDLFYFDGSGWTDSGIDFTAGANPQLTGRLAVSGTVSLTRAFYAIFLVDGDGDEVRDCLDCAPSPDNDGRVVWSLPGEPSNLVLTHSGSTTTLAWETPTDVGALPESIGYDTLRSDVACNFTSSLTAIETNNGPNTVAIDTDGVGPGVVRYYIVQSRNLCGTSSLGMGSAGERTGVCP